MSNNSQNDNAPKSKPSRAFDAYAIRKGQDGKGHFHKIGAAFQHKDGKGFDIDLVAAPTNGRVTLRTPQDRLDQARSGDNKAQPKDKTQERGRE